VTKLSFCVSILVNGTLKAKHVDCTYFLVHLCVCHSRSVGVVLYVTLSGVSPFLDESEEETCSNILRNDYCFPEEFFAGISAEAKEFIQAILVEDMG